MARKSLLAKEVVVVSDDEEEEDEDDDDANIIKYIKPVSVYKHLETRSKNNPYFLRKCLSYIIRAKKKKKSNSSVTIRFNYRDVRNKKTLKAEDVEKFTCPFCLMPCGGHEGLRLHLTSSHDAFNYDFYRAEEDHGPEVDVYLKRETLRFGVLKNDIGDPQLKRFMFCSKHRKGRRKRDDSDNLKRLNARLLELDLDELSRGTENESTHVNNDNVSSPPTRAHPLENTSDILTTTQPAIAESSEPMVVPLVSSGRKKLFAESSEPKVPPVSGRKKLSAQSSESKEPPVSGRKKSVAESSEPKVPPVSRRKKLSAESSEPKEPPKSSEPKVPPVSRRKKLSAESSEPKEPPESSEPKEPPVSRRKKLSVESSEPKVSPVSGRKELSAESSEPKEPPVSRRKKSFAERSKAKGVERLKSRQFYHSQTMQPMTFEEVMSNEDSENETDDDALDLHERLRLERIPGASKEEKRYMYLWNIFVRKQRVIADGHVPWACEEFTKLHKEEMKASPSFDWWWRMFRIKLWDDGLICANTFNKCTTIFLNSDEAGPSTSHGPANANTPTMEVDA